MVEEKEVRKLQKGYTPQGEGAKPQIAKVYDLTFTPFVKRKKLDSFFELYKRDDPVLKAWAFLGLYQILENKSYETEQTLNKLHEIIIDILQNDKEIAFWSGSIKTETTLRQHHAKRISWLDPYFVFEPVYEYCESSVGKLDKVVGFLLEEVVSKRSESRVENLLIKHGNNLKHNNFDTKLHLIRAFENFGEISHIGDNEAITDVFKQILNEVKKEEEGSGLDSREKKRRLLKDEIIRIGAKLDLDLEKEIISFIEQLDRPYNALHKLAEKFKDNKQFRTILLEKIENTKNRYFITDILRAFLVIKDKIDNWKELVINKVKQYELNDADLIIDLNKAELLSEEMIVNYLTKGTQWHLEFIREFLTTHPEKIEEWTDLRKKIIEILETFEKDDLQERPGALYYEKKKLALRIIVDLKWDDAIPLALENFKKLRDDELRKIALFAVITSKNNKMLDKLRAMMDKDKQTEVYVKRFWKYLEARDWQFFY
jgi:hypothetical protein